MNKTKYKTESIFSGGFEPVERVIVQHETKISVKIKGNWYRKETNYNRYFNTFEDAKFFMVDDTKKYLGKAEQAVVAIEKELLTVQNMTMKNSLIGIL